MKYDDLTWLATELGMSVLDEAPLIAAGSAAEDEWLVERFRSVLGGRATRADVARALMSVRAGRPMVLRLVADASGHASRALFAEGPGQRLVLLTNAVLEAADTPRASIEHRASVADAAAAMAHEVANATSAIAGWARLANSPDSGVSAERAVALIERAATAANQAARRLLRLARGEVSEAHEPLDISATTSDLVTLLDTVARENNVRLSAALAPELFAKASVATVFSVVWNLTKNAIEATPAQGAVHVSLALVNGLVTLQVRDQGPGLSPEAQAHIFEKYVTTKAHGTGLGLPLVRATVHELGGQLSVSSALGSGTTFTVTLPPVARDTTTLPANVGKALLAHAEHVDPIEHADPVLDHAHQGIATGRFTTTQFAPGTVRVAPAGASADVAGALAEVAGALADVASAPATGTVEKIAPRAARDVVRAVGDLAVDILIVEDDDPLREMMTTVLALRGARVTCARNIHEARNVTGRFDIALIDLALDECRGDELLASLRRRGIVSAAMLVTGSVQKPRIIAGGEPDDWVRKPFEITELVERIQRTLARHAMLEAAVGQRAGA